MISDINDIRTMFVSDNKEDRKLAIKLDANIVCGFKKAEDIIKHSPSSFDILFITPDMMGKICGLHTILGKMGKMPTPRYGQILDPNNLEKSLTIALGTIKNISREPKPDIINFNDCYDYKQKVDEIYVDTITTYKEDENLAKFVRAEVISTLQANHKANMCESNLKSAQDIIDDCSLNKKDFEKSSMSDSLVDDFQM